MGRAIRRVAAGWEHPCYTDEDVERNFLLYRNRVGQFRPLYDRSYSLAKREWLDAVAQWEAGTHPDQQPKADGTPRAAAKYPEYWDWDGPPPDRFFYRPDWRPEAMTWWQAYETVSEGTPVTPAFATAEALVGFLATQPDFMGDGPRSRESAERLVRGGCRPPWSSSTGRGPRISSRRSDRRDEVSHPMRCLALCLLAVPLAAQPRAHSDVRVRTHKPAGVPLRRLHPRIAVTPSHPDTARRYAGTAGGEVGPLPPVATVGTPARWPWLLVPLGLGAVALAERGHRDWPSDSVSSAPPPVVPPPISTPEPAPLALELAAVAVGGAYIFTRRRGQ